jgi:hypothetical protein
MNDNRALSKPTGAIMTSTLLITTLVSADHRRSFQILAAPSAGWEAIEEKDQHVVQRRHYQDWHRVERALARFAHEVDEPRKEGSREA